jgi:hypothetical protein
VVKFELNEKGASTEIVLDHTGCPEGAFRHLNSGWYLRDWEPLKKYLACKQRSPTRGISFRELTAETA